MSLGLLSSASLERTPEELCAGEYAASGPFVIDEVVPSQSVTVVRRDGYDWAPARAAHEGEAWLDAGLYALAHPPARRAAPPLWDGYAAARIIDTLLGVPVEVAA